MSKPRDHNASVTSEKTDAPRETRLLALRNVIENASIDPVRDDEIVATLRGNGGRGSHLRAMFGDAGLAQLFGAARTCNISQEAVLQAYVRAKRDAAAVNRELEVALSSRF